MLTRCTTVLKAMEAGRGTRRGRERRPLHAWLPEPLEGRTLLSWGWEPTAPFSGDDYEATIYLNQYNDATLDGLSLDPDGDIDGYEVYFRSYGDLTVETTGGTDMLLAFYPGPGAPTLTDDDGGEGVNSLITTNVSSGTMAYLAVRQFDAGTGAYGLHINGPTRAIPMNIPITDRAGSATGWIADQNDYELFTFEATQSGAWTIAAEPWDSLDPMLLVFDSGGNPIAGSFTAPLDVGGGGEAESWTGQLVEGQYYYVRVDGWYDSMGDFTASITGPNDADVLPVSLAVGAGKLQPGQKPQDLAFSIQNNGPLPATGTYVADFYLSADNVITAQDIPLGQLTLQLDLAPGAISSHAFNPAASAAINVQIPAGTAAGDYYTGIILTPTAAPNDPAMQNNAAAGSIINVDGAGDGTQSAIGLGAAGPGGMTACDFVGDRDAMDCFCFSVASPQLVTLGLAGLSAATSLALLSGGNIMAQQTMSSAAPATMTRLLAAGEYHAQIGRNAGNTPYSLSVRSDPAPRAPSSRLYQVGRTRPGKLPLRFKILYEAGSAMSDASISAKDILLRGPRRFQGYARPIKRSYNASLTTVAVTYEIKARGGSWDASDNGSYAVWSMPYEISDQWGQCCPKAKLGTIPLKFGKTARSRPASPELAVIPPSAAAPAARAFSADRLIQQAGDEDRDAPWQPSADDGLL